MIDVQFYGGPMHGQTITVKTDDKDRPPLRMHALQHVPEPITSESTRAIHYETVWYESMLDQDERWCYVTGEYLAATP